MFGANSNNLQSQLMALATQPQDPTLDEWLKSFYKRHPSAYSDQFVNDKRIQSRK